MDREEKGLTLGGGEKWMNGGRRINEEGVDGWKSWMIKKWIEDRWISGWLEVDE